MVKRYLPKGMFGRALLILLAPLVIVQGTVAAIIAQRHYAGVSNQMAAIVAAELNYAVALVEEAGDAAEARAEIERMAGPLRVALRVDEGRVVPREALRRFYDVTGGAVEETLKAEIRRPIALDLVSYDRAIEVLVQTDKGILRALVDRRRLTPANPHQLFVWMGLTSAAVLGVAVIFLRNQVRPIRQLAAAADAFGKGRALRFQPSGAEEVRRAGSAFLEMRARIERQIESRTRMLSGVSHDLRTPLTRMKLALAMLEEAPEAEELRSDVAEMERMIEAFLAFARGEAAEEALPIDPVALAEEVAAAARRAGGAVAVEAQVDTPEAPTATLRPEAMRRALQNLVDNAIAHGSRAAIRVRLERRRVVFTVEDDGPGIAPQDRETALRPFTRLDLARNQNAGGGVGLGLSIAADIARAHGGALTLHDSEALGGLAARLRAPR